MPDNNDDRVRKPYGPDRRAWCEQLPDMAKTETGYLVSPPSADPVDAYEDASLPALEATDLQVPPRALRSSERKRAMARIDTYEEMQNETFLGFQTEMRFDPVDYKHSLSGYLNTQLNNVGDPFQGGNLSKNTKFAERAVLDYYASLWNAKWPSVEGDGESYWGYVLSMGATEGNLYAVMQARDYLKGKPLNEVEQTTPLPDLPVGEQGYDQVRQNPNAHHVVAFFSEDRHYSVFKALRAMEVDTFGDVGERLYPGECPITADGSWPYKVPSTGPEAERPIGRGEIDVDKLAILVEFFAARGFPMLFILNLGTTFKGAYDPVDTIGNRILPILERYGLAQRRVWPDPARPEHHDWRTGFWIHVDGALGASFLPFIEMAHNAGQVATKGPAFDFRLPYVHSLVMSGHKWPGTPWPTGIYMTRRRYLIKPPEDPDYIGCADTTFAGSRNGLSPLLLWQYTAMLSYTDQRDMALRCQDTAAYAVRELQAVATEKGIDLWVQRSPLALTMLFRQPNEQIVFDFSLSTEPAPDPDDPTKVRPYAHLFCMRGVSKDLIDRLVARLREPGAFPEAEVRRTAPPQQEAA